VAQREGLSNVDALDVVQEAFQLLLTRPDLEIDPEQAYRTLATMVRNGARNLRRLHRNAKPHTDVDAVEIDAQTPPPDTALEAAAVQSQLANCLARLGDVHQQIVRLRVLEELSGAEVAAQLGLTQNHIGVLLHRAKKELERCMLG
jgi:RNA polymerase sigma-70 factor (ECF subfamily)